MFWNNSCWHKCILKKYWFTCRVYGGKSPKTNARSSAFPAPVHVFTPHVMHYAHASICAGSTAQADKQIFTPEHFVSSRGNHRHGSCGQGFLAGLKHWFLECTLFSAPYVETQTLAFIHTCTQSLNPVRWNKKAALAELRSAQVHTFLECWLWSGALALNETWTATSPWVVNLLSSHHSQSPLANRIKCSARPQKTLARTSFFIWIPAWGSGQKSSYVNESRVKEMCWEEYLSS